MIIQQFIKKDLIRKNIYKELKDEIKRVVEPFRFVSVEINRKTFSQYDKINCPAIKIVPDFEVSGNLLEENPTIWTIKAFVYVIYHNSCKDEFEIFDVVDAISKSFNGSNARSRNNLNGLTLGAEVESVQYSDPVAFKDQSIVEVSMLIKVTNN